MIDLLRSLAGQAVRTIQFRRTPTGRSQAALRRAARRKPFAEVNEVDVLGYRITGFHPLTLLGLFDEIFVGHEYRFASDTEAPVIVDCGANIGFSVLHFKTQYPRSRIVAFEANPHAFRMLERNVTVNGLQDVELRQCALGNLDGATSFFVNSDPGSLVCSTRQDRGGEQRIEVMCERLSHTLAAADRVDVVKMDVEGAEWAILDDLIASGTLSKPRRYLIEYHHQLGGESARLCRFLSPFEQAGYRYQIAAHMNEPTAFQDVLLHLVRD